jgi:PadR family transcriptional regulator PadR
MTYDADLMRGIVQPIVLQLVSERAMYGYEIIKIVNQRTNKALEWKEGTLYPCLHRLEGSGLIKSTWETAESGRKRKYYAITRRGLATLKKKASEWASFAQAVNALLSVPQKVLA